MIQELLNIFDGSQETKFSINGKPLLLPHTPSLSSSSASQSSTTATATTTSLNSEKLRCPRCDSSNTKFCYYNNYNLSQPRHFCKTCRRYWTKGGALRNIPIGGGCRKNRSARASSSASKSGASKMQMVASELGRSRLGPGFESGPILWGTPRNTEILTLMGANQIPNSNHNPSLMSLNAVSVNSEGKIIGGSQSGMTTESLLAKEALNQRISGYENGFGVYSSVWRNYKDQNNGFVVGENQSRGFQDIYNKKLMSSSSVSYCGDMASSSSSFSSSSSLCNVLEPCLVSASELFGCWNPMLSSWSDLPTTNGAYP